jgi:hypothetical protein
LGTVNKEEAMSGKIYMIALGLAGALAVGSPGASQAAVFPTNASAIKAAVPDSIIEVRRGAVAVRGPRGGAVAVRGYRGGAVGYRGGYYGGGYGYPWGAAAGAAAIGAAAAGAGAYYYGQQQCGYYPYPPCY